MIKPFITNHRVEFRDTDAAGIMHFSTFLTYMEESEHEFLRSLGLSVMQCETDGASVSWPRVSVNCDYQAPLHFEETFEVQVSIEKLGTKSVQYQFRFVKEAQTCATGTLTAVCCQLDDSGMNAIEIPELIRAKLTPFLDD
ncbi:MAG: thioesterase family protein [Planctomycetota bacterium]|jgi:acyl-CoA thioester hydrolase|nr:thioesterase family protein [Planctomycetota bacterium]